MVKQCTFLECSKKAAGLTRNKGATGLCISHGGGPRCTYLGCTLSARGASGLCISHGGRPRCTYLGCTNGARGAIGLCKRHGGGPRCTYLGCTNSARGASGLCISHGGGPRCTYLGCTNGTQDATGLCITHGGGPRCTYLGCTNGALGATGLCKRHGGGPRCPNCIDWIDSQGANPKYNGYCYRCYCKLYPNDPRIRRNNKTKESAVHYHIRKCFPELNVVNDRRISGGCSRRKPDFFIELLTHVVIIEVDEHAHLTYDQRCENRRMMELSEDIGHRPMVLIRFNPDGNSNGPSCWGVNNSGLAVVKKKRAAEWQERLSTLMATINYWLTTIPGKTVEVIKLFY